MKSRSLPLPGLVTALRIAVAAVLLLCATLAAMAENAQPLKGVALVIGQSAYAHLPKLANPGNDARAMDRLLTDLGFEVVTVTDGDQRKLERSLRRFAEDAEGADVALIFYSGHGIEAGGENFLVPVDAPPPEAGMVTAGLVPVSAVLSELQASVPVVIALLDACRTDPFPAGTLVRVSGQDTPVAIGSAGLAAPKGAVPLAENIVSSDSLATVLGFSAEPGHVALDGDAGANSPYVAALLKHLSAGGLDFGDVMTMVTEEVYLATGTRQRPWTNASLRRLLYFGLAPASEPTGDEAAIRGERRKLLLTIAATPADMRDLVETIARKDAVPLDQLYGMLKVIGVDPNLRGDQLATQLQQGAEKLRDILVRRDAVERGDPEIGRLAGLADRAEREGAIALALEFRSRASLRADEVARIVDETETDIKERRVELASTYASNGDTAVLNFDFAMAAQKYAAAYDQARRFDPKLAYICKSAQAGALVDHGTYSGDKQSLEQGVDTYYAALKMAPRDMPRDDLAVTRTGLANALLTLAERENGHERLDEATGVVDSALKLVTRDKEPEQWAGLQLILGNVAGLLADRSGDPAEFEKSISAYRLALEVFTRERDARRWSGLQHNIGSMLKEFSARTGDDAALDQAIEALQAALEVRTRAAMPMEWAATQGSLGAALGLAGIRRNDSALLERALAAFNAELEIVTREKIPFDWSGAQNNIANVLEELGNREAGTARLEQAVTAIRASLSERPRENDAIGWAISNYNLGRVLKTIGDRTHSADTYAQSIATFRLVTTELASGHAPLLLSRTQGRLAEALLALGKTKRDAALIEEARKTYEDAWAFWKGQGEKRYDKYFTSQLTEVEAALKELR